MRRERLPIGSTEGLELRPAFLDMKEVAANPFAAVWKLPAHGSQCLRHRRLNTIFTSDINELGGGDGGIRTLDTL